MFPPFVDKQTNGSNLHYARGDCVSYQTATLWAGINCVLIVIWEIEFFPSIYPSTTRKKLNISRKQTVLDFSICLQNLHQTEIGRLRQRWLVVGWIFLSQIRCWHYVYICSHSTHLPSNFDSLPSPIYLHMQQEAQLCTKKFNFSDVKRFGFRSTAVANQQIICKL